MNARTSRFSRFCFGLIGAAALVLLCGQGVHAQTPATSPIQQPDGTLTNGVPDDWSMHHLVFANAEKASAKGMSEKLSKIVNNPRYILQQKRQLLGKSSEAAAISVAAAKSSDAANASPEAAKTTGNASKTKSATTRDWTLPLGSGGVARNMWPANFYSGDATGAAGPPPTGYCKDDFVVVGLNVVSSTLQANLVAIDDLYTGSGGACGTGTTPTVKWAYNTSTNASGMITTSPTLSLDGTQVAFVESTGANNSGESIFHVLKWADASGTASVTAPTMPTAVSSTVGCTAPCMVSITYNNSFGDTYASPFYDFNTDTAYVGDDSGTLWAISGVFFGTPTVSSTAPFGGGLQLSGSAGQITAPVYDYSSGNIFVGGQDGMLYAVSSTTGAIVSTAVGNGGTAGYLAAAPIVDGFDGTVLEYGADNAAGIGAATAATKAVVVQADTTTPLGNPQVAIIGEGNLGTTGTLTLAPGTFDNNYNNYSGTGANSGHFYEIGTAAGAQNPVLYQLSYSGVNAVMVTGGTGGATNPTVSIAAPGGTGNTTATASTTGGVFGITVTAPGTGYTSAPTVTFTGGGGSGASGATTNYSLATVGVTAAGSNYTAVPTVTIGGSGTGGGTATVALGIDAATLTAGGSYTSRPTVTFPGGSTNGTGTTSVGLLTITPGGTNSGYTTVPGVTIGGTGSGGSASASMGLNAVTASGGTGYTSVPSITFTGGTQTVGGPGGASATAALGLVTGNPVAGAVVSSGGSYSAIPTSTCTGGTTNGGCVPVVGLVTIGVSAGGSGYTAVPSVGGFTSGTETTAGAAQASAGLNAVTVSAGGTGYTSVPTVNVNGGTQTAGGPGAATATAALGLVTGTAVGTITTGGSYTGSIPGVTFPTGSTPGTGSALVGLSSIAGSGGSFTSLPTVTIGGTGSGGTAVPVLSVSSIAVSGTNSAYTAPPTISFTAGGSPAAAATAVMGVGAVSLTGDGTGYTSVPSVAFSTSGSTTAATATAALGVVSVTLTANGCYSNGGAAPTVSFSGGGGSGATATLTLGSSGGDSCTSGHKPVTGVTVTAAGTGYTSVPTVVFTCTGTCSDTTAAAATAALEVVSITLTGAGSGYTSNPSVTISGGTTNATATTTLKIVSVTVGTAGSYTNIFPAATTTGNATLTTTATALGINVTAAGSYSTFPTATLTGVTTTVTATVVGITVATAGAGYTAGPAPATFASGTAAGTVPLKVVSVTPTAAGSYTALPTSLTIATGFGGSGTTLAATYALVSVAVTTAGDYTVLPTLTVSGTGGTGASVSITGVTVVGMAVTTAGTGYTTGPVTVTFGSGTAAATVPLTVVSGAITAAGSYTALPTIGISGGGGTGATVSGTYRVVSVAVNAAGSYTTFPTATASTGNATFSVTALVVGVTVSTAGTGYTSGPVTLTFAGTGVGGAAATADLKLVSAAVTAAGNYTSIPTASVPGGATLTATAGILAASVSSGGTGYTSDPSVTFTGGSGTGGTGSTTITVTGVALTYGGGGYSAAPTVTISCGGCGATATATINPGSIMTAGTVPNCGTNCTVNASTIAVASPLDEMFTTGGVDRIYFGYGNTTVASAVVGQTVTNGTISAPSPAAYTVPDGIGGSSAIVLDAVTTIAQANSMYFVEQAESAPALAIASASAPGTFFAANVVTVTMQAPENFATNDSVTIAGMTCSSGTCPSGPYTITVTSSTTFTFSTCTLLCGKITANNDTGTATDPSKAAYNAVKLTQTGLD